MLTVLAFHEKDADQTERLAHWIAELGGCKGHELILGVDHSVPMAQSAFILELFTPSFDKVTPLPISNPYNDDEHAWPRAANHAWSTLARHIDENKLAPYFCWLEPDAVPLSDGWIERLEMSHVKSEKVFTGAYVRGANGSADKMSGIGVYPGNLVQYAGIALIADEVAWDQAAASQIVPLANFTRLIFHQWKGLNFESIEELREMIGPEPVLYHSDKTGKTIELLRAEMNFETLPSRVASSPSGVSNERPRPTSSDNLHEIPHERQASDAVTGGLLVKIGTEAATQPAPASGIIPWANKKESLDYIDSLALELKKFCTAPRSTLVVRERLRKIKVITKVR